MVVQAFRKDYAIETKMVSIRMRRNAMMNNVSIEATFYIMKNKSDKMKLDGGDDIDAKMCAAFSCVDCDQEHESRQS